MWYTCMWGLLVWCIQREVNIVINYTRGLEEVMVCLYFITILIFLFPDILYLGLNFVLGLLSPALHLGGVFCIGSVILTRE